MIPYFKRKVQYMSIADELRKGIMDKKPLPGTAVMSCRELAKSYQVSVGTAEKAIEQLVKEELLYRKRGSGTYIRQLPRSIKHLTIGCTFRTDYVNSTQEKLLIENNRIIQDYIRNHHCEIRFIPNGIYAKEEKTAEYFSGLDGLLISACSVDLEECKHLHTLKIPVVIFQGEYEHDLPFSQVIPDHMPAMRELFRIAKRWKFDGCMILHARHHNAYARRNAFIRAAAESGTLNPECIETTENEAYKLGLLLAKRCRGKLILSCSDMISFNVLNAFHDCKLVPSQDYHFVSYDNVEGLGIQHYAIPTVTAIHFDCSKVALLASKILIQETQKRSDLTHIIKVPTKLVIRESAFKTSKERSFL